MMIRRLFLTFFLSLLPISGLAATFITPVEITPASTGWQDVDVSSYVPAGTTGVMLHFVNKAASTVYIVGWQKNGSTDNRTANIRPNVHFWCAIGVDANRVLEISVSNTTNVDVYLVGYFGSEAVFFDNAHDKSIGQDAWTDINISVDTGADTAIGAIFQVINTDTVNNRTFGMQNNGSTDYRQSGLGVNPITGTVVGVDDSEICEGYVGYPTVDFYLVGYLTRGAFFNVNATDLSLASTGNWYDLAALPEGAIGGIIEVWEPTATSTGYGLRKNGSSEAIIYDTMTRHSWAMVEADANRVIEGYIGDTNYDFYLLGYFLDELTLVDIVNFKAETNDKQAIITWRTASELGTKGFRVYRTFLPSEPKTYERLTPEIIPALGNPLSGRKYSFIDNEPLSGCYYILEEVLKDGGKKMYNPVQLDNYATFIGGDSAEETKAFLRRDGKVEIDGNVVSRKIKPERSFSNRHCEPQRGEAIPSSRLLRSFPSLAMTVVGQQGFAPLKIEINQEGMYRINADDLINAGWDINKIDPRSIAMFNQGRQLPIFVRGESDKQFNSGDYIEFYGKPVSGRFTNTNIYWLKLLHNQYGMRIQSINSQQRFPLQTTCIENSKLEENASYYSEFKGDEHWFFSDEFIAPYSADFYLNLDHIDASFDSTANLEISLQGGSQMGFGTDHNRQLANIYLNGEPIGMADWNLDKEHIFSRQVPVSKLKEGENKITIEAPDEEGSLEQFFLLNWIKISYPRQLFARENKIIFDSWVNSRPASYKIRGFTSSDIKGFTIRDSRVWRLANLKVRQEEEGDYSAAFSDPRIGSSRYIILAENLIDKPPAVYPDKPSSLKDDNNQADYIIITHNSFIGALRPLVEYRSLQGLNVKTVDAEDIYDEFNSGIFSPEAIRKFLKFAYDNWKSPKPVFVLLVGDGTFDYQDFWGIGLENLVPAYLVDSPVFGETVSDNWYADFDEDKVPEMFIGRFPVNDVSQLNTIIEKVLAYESESPESNWAKHALFVADNDVEFEEAAESLSALFPSGFENEKLYLSRLSPEEVRQGIIDGINQGRLVFNFIGHGGVTMLSGSQIFRNEDVQFLDNEYRYPLFLALDCATGYFIYPEGLDSLSEALLFSDKKGAVACITPSGLSSVPEQKVFAEGFYRALFEQEEPLPVLGALHFKAKEYLYDNRVFFGAGNKVENVIQTYNLLGDPALIVRREGAPSGYSFSLLLRLHNLLEN